MDLASNGEEFGEQRYTPLRWTSALFGSAVSPIMYFICRELGLSFPASIVPAVMQVFDHIVVVESRLVLVDAQLLFFKSLCLLLALRLWGARKGTRRRFILLVGTALAGAAAISVKWTALATPGLVAIVSLLGRPFPLQGRLEVSEMAVAGSVAISFYAAVFWVHFRLLPNSGDGDAFMRRRFQRTLIGGSHYDPKVRPPSFAANFIWLNGEMYRANARIKTRHPWESKWYQWIIDQRGLLYYKDPQTSGKLGQIYLIVNPVVAGATLTALIAFVVVLFGVYIPQHRMGALTSYSKLHGFVTRGLFFAAGFVINILPYLGALCASVLSICLRFTHGIALTLTLAVLFIPMRASLAEISRCTFVYHYIPALFYSQLALANAIDVAPRRLQRGLCVTLCTLVIIAFLIWAPWIYGTPMLEESHAWRRLYGKHWK